MADMTALGHFPWNQSLPPLKYRDTTFYHPETGAKLTLTRPTQLNSPPRLIIDSKVLSDPSTPPHLTTFEYVIGFTDALIKEIKRLRDDNVAIREVYQVLVDKWHILVENDMAPSIFKPYDGSNLVAGDWITDAGCWLAERAFCPSQLPRYIASTPDVQGLAQSEEQAAESVQRMLVVGVKRHPSHSLDQFRAVLQQELLGGGADGHSVKDILLGPVPRIVSDIYLDRDEHNGDVEEEVLKMVCEESRLKRAMDGLEERQEDFPIACSFKNEEA